MAKPIPKRKIPEKTDSMGVTLLMEAAKQNVPEKVIECIEMGHNIDATDNAGYTALMHAVVADNEEIALLLMHHKAALGNANRAGENALHMATKKTGEETMDQFVERWVTLQGPLDAQDKLDGHTALMNAIAAGNAWQACRLVRAGADFDTLTDTRGYNRRAAVAHSISRRRTRIISGPPSPSAARRKQNDGARNAPPLPAPPIRLTTT